MGCFPSKEANSIESLQQQAASSSRHTETPFADTGLTEQTTNTAHGSSAPNASRDATNMNQQQVVSANHASIDSPSNDQRTNTTSTEDSTTNSEKSSIKSSQHDGSSRIAKKFPFDRRSSNTSANSSSMRSHYSHKASFYEESSSHNHRVLLKKKHNSSLIPVSSFLPSALIKYISKNLADGKPVEKEFTVENVKASLLFLDISGFTPLFQKTVTQKNGAERVTQHVNAYFSLLLDAVFKHGGDVEKWAGDAMLVMFYDDDLKKATFRALKCALEIQHAPHLNQYEVDDVQLTLHCGVSSGSFTCYHVGGVRNEWKRILLGEPLQDLEQAVSESQAGEVMISKRTHELIHNDVEVVPIVNSDAVLLQKILTNEYASNTGSSNTITPLTPSNSHPSIASPIVLTNQMEAAMRSFIDPFTLEKIDAQQADSSLLSSIKTCSMVFITLSPKTDKKASKDPKDVLASFHQSLRSTQEIVQSYEGSIVNFLADEKGVLLALCFGHPFAHTNDPYRAIISSLKITERLKQNESFSFGIGIATGKTFVGAIGSMDRRDFTTISASANTSARLMKHSQLKENSHIICDETTFTQAQNRIKFQVLEPVQMKGHLVPMPIFKVLSEKQSDLLAFNSQRSTIGTIRFSELDLVTKKVQEAIVAGADVGPDTPPGEPQKMILIKKHGPGVGCTRFLRALLLKEEELKIPLFYHVSDDLQKRPFEIYGEWARGILVAYAQKHNLLDACMLPRRRKKRTDSTTTPLKVPSSPSTPMESPGFSFNKQTPPSSPSPLTASSPMYPPSSPGGGSADNTTNQSNKDQKQQAVSFVERRKLLLRMPLEQKKEILLKIFETKPKLLPYVCLINSVLEVDFVPTPIVSNRIASLTTEAKQQLATKLVMHLLEEQFKLAFLDLPLTVGIYDDFHFSDEDSTRAFFDIFFPKKEPNYVSSRVLPVVCVDTTATPPKLLKLLEETASTVVEFGELTAPQMEQIIIEAAESSDVEALHVEPDLIDFTLKKAGADLSRAQLIVQKLFMEEFVLVEEETRTLMIHPLRKQTISTLEIPHSNSLMVQQRIDRLDANARLVLKIASVIGNQFSFETLESIFPTDVSAYENLREHLSTIIDTGNLVAPTDDLTYDGKKQFAFVSRHVRNIAYSGLLESLKTQIHGELALYYTQIYNLDRATKQFTIIDDLNTALWNELLTTAEHFSHSLCTLEPTLYTEDAIALIRIVVEELVRKEEYQKAFSLQQQKLAIIRQRIYEGGDDEATYIEPHNPISLREMPNKHLTIRCLVNLIEIIFTGQLWTIKEYDELASEYIDEAFSLALPSYWRYADLCIYSWWRDFRAGRHDSCLGIYDKFKASLKTDTEEFYFYTCYALTHYSLAHFDQVVQHTQKANALYQKHQEGIFGTKSKGILQHDMLINVILFESRAQFFLGNLKSSKRAIFEAENVEEKREHIFTSRYTFLYSLYVLLLRHDYEHMLSSIGKLEKIAARISSDNTSFFYLSMREMYHSYVKFMTCKNKDEYEILYARVKKHTTSEMLDNHIIFVSLLECALIYLRQLKEEKKYARFLKEVAYITSIMHNNVVKSPQEHLKSELFRLYADVLSLKRELLKKGKKDAHKLDFIFEDECEQVLKYDLKTRKPIIAAKKPIGVKLKAGQTVLWCASGLCTTQPFCEESEACRESGLKPLRYTPEKDMDAYFCACKQTLNPPFCDGTHRSLTDKDLVGGVRVSNSSGESGSATTPDASSPKILRKASVSSLGSKSNNSPSNSRKSSLSNGFARKNSLGGIDNGGGNESPIQIDTSVPSVQDIKSWYERALSLCATQKNRTIALKVYLSMWKFYKCLEQDEDEDEESNSDVAFHNLSETYKEFSAPELDVDLKFVREVQQVVEDEEKFNRELILLVKHDSKKVKIQLKKLSSVKQLKQRIAKTFSMLEGAQFRLTFLDPDFGEDVDILDDVSILPSKAVLTVWTE